MEDSTSEIFGSKRKRFRKWWEQLSYMEQKLIISLVIISTTLIFLVSILTVKSAVSNKTCTTSDCIISAAEIVSYTNPVVDPCHDFYRFTCEKLKESSKKRVSLTYERVQEEIIDTLMTPINDKDTRQLQIQKKLFSMCLNKSEGEESFVTMKTIFKELHGWPVILGFNWKAGSFDWVKTTIRLKQMGLPFNMLISIELIPSKDTRKHLLYIGKPKLPKITQKYRHEYRRLMSEVAFVFGAEKSRAANDMRRVLDFTNELEKLIETKHLNRRVKLIEMQNHFADVNWINFINAILEPTSNILPEHYVVTPSEQFLENLLNLISRTPKRIQANYIMWTVVEKYLPFLSDKIKHLHSNYAYVIDSVSAPQERLYLQQCNDAVSNSFLTPPSETVYVEYRLGLDKMNEILAVGKNLQLAFEMFLKESTLLNENIRMIALSKIQNLKIVGGLRFDPQETQTTTIDRSKSFLNNLLDNHKSKYERIYGQLYLDSSFTTTFPIYTSEVMYVPESNVLFLPVAAYLENIPRFLTYGELGTVISQNLVHNVLPKNSPVWTKKAYDSLACMSQKNVTGGDESLLDLIGILLSHAAYQLWTHEHEPESRLIGIHYTPNQLFWISSFFGFCTKHRDHNYLVNTITRSHPNFAADFECPWGSPMNPYVHVDYSEVFVFSRQDIFNSELTRLRYNRSKSIDDYPLDSPTNPFKNVEYFNFTYLVDHYVISKNLLINFASRNMKKRICFGRTKVETILIIAIVILALVLVILIVLLAQPKDSFVPTKIAQCTSQTCLKEALNILNRIDLEVDPCENFYKFACNNVRRVDKDYVYGPFQRIANEFHKNVEEMYSDPIRKRDHPVVNFQKQLYRMCVNETRAEEDAFETIKKNLEYAGGWPILEGHKWNESNFNWARATHKLRSLGHSYSIFLDVSVVVDPDNKDKYIAKVSIPEIEDVYSKHFNSDETNEFMADVAVAFGAEVHRALGEMTQTLEFLLDLQWVQSNNEASSDEGEEYNRITIAEAQRKHDAIDWLNFINEILKVEPKLSYDDYVLFPCETAIDSWTGVLTKAPKRLLANYMMWRVVQENLPFITNTLRREKVQSRIKLEDKEEKRSEYCIRLVRESFSPSPVDVVFLRNNFPTRKVQNMYRLLEGFKSELKNLIERSDWIEKSTKNELRNKIDSVKIVWGAPDEYLNDNIFDNMNFNFTVTTFLNALTRAQKNNINRLYGLLRESPRTTKLFWWKMPNGEPEMHLHQNVVELAPSTRYDEDGPNYLNYAITGLLAKNFLYKLVEGYYDWSSKTKCGVNTTGAPDYLLYQPLSHLIATTVSYNTYNSEFRENREETLFPLNYTTNQLFWIAAGDVYCYYLNPSSNLDESSKHLYEVAIKKVINRNRILLNDFECLTQLSEDTCGLY